MTTIKSIIKYFSKEYGKSLIHYREMDKIEKRYSIIRVILEILVYIYHTLDEVDCYAKISL